MKLSATFLTPYSPHRLSYRASGGGGGGGGEEEMADWGPVFVAVILFVLLTPGLVFQVPGKSRLIEFGNFHTSGISIVVHSVIYFALVATFFLAVHVHMYIGH
ncbi:hypothetical protein GW17_00000587 [Ensete ventricosum]|nr:hypothetical protein GW17_00000587 [Ensete ventricosum]RZR76642.1 hypothetical protein BHM03_00001484 [Ensete ventricosum]